MKTARFLLFLLILLAAVAAFFVYVPYGPTSETFVDIPAGTGTAGIAAKLEQAGAIRSRFVFEAWRQFKGGTLRAGEYRFDHPAAISEVYLGIARGDVYTLTLVVPEGFNIFDIADAVEKPRAGQRPGFPGSRAAGYSADLRPEPECAIA